MGAKQAIASEALWALAILLKLKKSSGIEFHISALCCVHLPVIFCCQLQFQSNLSNFKATFYRPLLTSKAFYNFWGFEKYDCMWAETLSVS